MVVLCSLIHVEQTRSPSSRLVKAVSLELRSLSLDSYREVRLEMSACHDT